jgi:hypothetical protein
VFEGRSLCNIQLTGRLVNKNNILTIYICRGVKEHTAAMVSALNPGAPLVFCWPFEGRRAIIVMFFSFSFLNASVLTTLLIYFLDVFMGAEVQLVEGVGAGNVT